MPQDTLSYIISEDDTVYIVKAPHDLNNVKVKEFPPEAGEEIKKILEEESNNQQGNDDMSAFVFLLFLSVIFFYLLLIKKYGRNLPMLL